MKNSKFFPAICTASLAIFAVGLSSPSVTFAASNQRVSAGVNASCSPTQREIIVPPGQTATSFSISRFSGGYGCGTGNIINDGGFEISRGACPAQGGDVYWYRQTLSGSESRPTLGSLNLQPGTYCVSFNGGRNGSVELEYRLVP